MSEKKTDLDILVDILDHHEEALDQKALDAFTRWRIDLTTRRMRGLTEKQKAWLYGQAERLGAIGAAPAENLFSKLSPARQEEQRRAAAKVKLPWER